MFWRRVIYCFAILASSHFFACNDVPVQERLLVDNDSLALRMQIDSLSQVIVEQDSMLIYSLTLFSEIENNFHSMRGRKDQIMQYARNYDEDDLEEIRKNFISYIQGIGLLLTENKEKISEFKQILSERNIHIAKLGLSITEMERELNMRDQEIRTLGQQLKNKDSEISLLENMIETMNAEFQNMGSIIRRQQEQLNTAWYCVADKKTLLNSALISKRGKVLSIDASLAKKIDIEKDKEILIRAKKIELLTVHPADSYKLIYTADFVEKLQILDSKEFWSISKYCVIQIRN